MNDVAFLEHIVQEVMRRLRSIEREGGAVEPRADTNHPASLTLDLRVVTLASIHGQLEGIAQVTVRHDAIVTPSVSDELRDRNIALRRQSTKS